MERPAFSQSAHAQTPPVQLAAAVDPNPATRAEITTRYNIPTFPTVDDLLAADLHLDAATVAVPTRHHAAVATQLLEANLDVLIEKPLTATLQEADALLALAASRNRILAAGHLERFNPAVTAALARLTRPMFFEAHRLSIFTPRSLDVDVVLDLMIHDLDILLTMAGSPVTEVRAVGLPVLSPKTDIANVRLEFASGAVANLTASRVSTEQVRKLRLFQPAQYLSLDYARQELLTINVDPTLLASFTAPNSPLAPSFTGLNNPLAATAPSVQHLHQTPSSRPEERSSAAETPASPSPRPEGTSQPHRSADLTAASGQQLHPTLSSRPEERNSVVERPASPSARAEGTSQPHPSAGLTFNKLDLPRAEPLRLELEDFLHAVATRTSPRVIGGAGRTALALALDINREIATHAQRTGLLA